MLWIQDLSVAVEGQVILQHLDLRIPEGEVHAIMGPNGAGKSTLANVLAGRPGYEVLSGSISYRGESLLSLSVTERAHRGVFLAMQYPVEMPGVSNAQFLQTAYNATNRALGKEPMEAAEFLQWVRELMDVLQIPEDFLFRSVNEDFSGGEKKRNEMLQLLLLSPSCMILDEMDSGLDIDALQTIAKAVNMQRRADRLVLMITHYQRLLDHIVPDRIHVLHRGKIIHSGDSTLAHTLEEKGYGWLTEEA